MTKLDLGPPPEKVIARIKNVWDRCDIETRLLLDDLFNHWETASLDLVIFNLRLQKQWAEGSNLYNQKEVDKMLEDEYDRAAYNNSSEDEYDGHFIR